MPSDPPAAGAVLFDLDGTLLDTAPDFARVLNRLLADHGRPPLPYERVRATVSNGARALVSLAFGLDEHEDGFEPLRQRLLDYYIAGLAEETTPFPGIRSLLAELATQRLAWGIVTNKPSLYTDPLLDCMAMLPAPASVVCPDHVQRSKPDPEALLLACRQMGVAPAACLYVGDHHRDIEAGRRAGMVTVAVRWGYIDGAEDIDSWQADHCVDTPGEIGRLASEYFAISTARH